MWKDITYSLEMKLNFLIRTYHGQIVTLFISFSGGKNDSVLNTQGQLGFSNVLPALKVNLPDNTNESELCQALIHGEMLIKILAYKKMNDLKDAPDKSSQKWLC